MGSWPQAYFVRFEDLTAVLMIMSWIDVMLCYVVNSCPEDEFIRLF